MNEATPSVILQILDYLKQNFNFSTLILSGATFICGLLFRGLTKEFFDERARIAKHRRDVARLVLKICIEASTNHFRKLPRDMEHIHSVLTDLKGVDRSKSKFMEELITSWCFFAQERTKEGLNGDEVRFASEQRNRAEEKREILERWANRIRAGKKHIFW